MTNNNHYNYENRADYAGRPEPQRVLPPEVPEAVGPKKPSGKQVPTRSDGGIPEKVYIPYRALAMLAFTIAIVLGMFAILKFNSNPKTDTQTLAEVQQSASSEQPASASASSNANSKPNQPDVSLCVYNAGNRVGLASSIVKELNSAHFDVDGNGQNFPSKSIKIEKTTVFYPADHKDEADRIVKTLAKENAVTVERPQNLSVCPHGIAVVLS